LAEAEVATNSVATAAAAWKKRIVCMTHPIVASWSAQPAGWFKVSELIFD
jgi:hypothetical protein